MAEAITKASWLSGLSTEQLAWLTALAALVLCGWIAYVLLETIRTLSKGKKS
jgi:hypothetical protein